MSRSILEEPTTFDTYNTPQHYSSKTRIKDPDDTSNPDKGLNTEDFAIYLACLIFIFAFYFWLTYAIASDIYTKNVTSSTAVNQCFPGQCPTDQKTGEKICPIGDQTYAYNITTQVCNYPGLCQNTMPYSVNSDGSANINGICETNPVTGLPLNCLCSNQLTCPDYVLSSVNVISGNPYASNTDTQFAQNLISAYGGTGDKISKPNTGFCQMPLSWMLKTTPGCVGATGSTDLEIAKNCLKLNPCLQGVLAYITPNVSLVTSANLGQLTVACVRPDYFESPGTPIVCDIPNGYLPFYDLLSNSVICKLICPNGYQARYNGGIQNGYQPPNNYGCYPN